MNRFQRNEMLFTSAGAKALSEKKVTVFGVGGVGGYVCEMLCRSGVGTLRIVDHDTVDETNINRQIIALSSTVGMDKVDAMTRRLKDINPDCTVIQHKIFFLPESLKNPENSEKHFDFEGDDFVVDAIDTVSSKIALAQECARLRVPLVSSMGTGNRLRPEMLEICDISQTEGCPLARVMRRELRKRGILHLPVLFSRETPVKPEFTPEKSVRGAATPASSPFVPSAAGILIASYVVRRLLQCEGILERTHEYVPSEDKG